MSETALRLPWRAGQDPAKLREREWLVTNGLGGFASGSVLGPVTRRYHGLFVPNLASPKGRYVLISRLDEIFEQVDGQRILMGGTEYIDERLESQTPQYLEEFRFENLMPTWIYRIGEHRIEKTIVMPHGQNTVCVQYRLIEGAPVQMRIRPYMAFRRQDAVLQWREGWPFEVSIIGDRHEVRSHDGSLKTRMCVHPTGAAVLVAESLTSDNVLFRAERDRGYDHSENVFSPGYFQLRLESETPVSFVATAHSWEALQIDGPAAIDAERQRVERLLSIAPKAAQSGFAQHLVTAADQFLILPGSRLEETVLANASGSEIRTVIAGYHWFGDWGRDTMISLEGLTLCTGRYREAGAILRTFSHYVRDGLLPNLFPEGAREALYHTVDATLWFFHAIDRYQRTVGDEHIVAELFPVLRTIIEHHVRGTHYGIGIDPEDGLIRAGAPGYQLTWMDAKVGDWVVTPRRGKPVEIQALWYNALRLMAEWAARLGLNGSQYSELAQQAQHSFNQRYWNPNTGHLYDVMDGEGGDDPSCRPNQMFSLSLHYPILDEQHWVAVVEVVRAKLLTPLGLRTLSADHPDYKRNYEGDLRARDAAYHQGTVWPWLIGHFVDATLRVHGDISQARGVLEHFSSHLLESGVGSISEIFDAEPPYTPRGCIAQAWSVAEVLRAWLATEPAR